MTIISADESLRLEIVDLAIKTERWGWRARNGDRGTVGIVSDRTISCTIYQKLEEIYN